MPALQPKEKGGRLQGPTRILVVSHQLASQIASIDQLETLLTLSTSDGEDTVDWHLETDDRQTRIIRAQPRTGCADMATVRGAAIDGLGVAILPDHVRREALLAGRLVRVLPAWRGQRGIVHLVCNTRRGLPPAVRALINHLAGSFPREVTAG